MHPCDQASWRLNWESQRSRSASLRAGERLCGRLQPCVGGGYVYEREGKVSGWKTSLLESLQQRAQRGRWHNWQQRVRKCNMEIQ